MSDFEASDLFYRLDAEDRIVEAGGKWDDFARANCGDKVLAERVLGSHIFEHVHGDVSTMFLRTLLDGARTLQRTSTRPYRCDSPGIKRFMEMTLSPEPDGGVTVAHRLLKSEALPRRFNFAVPPRSITAFAVRCSMCNRVKCKGEWQEPEVAWAAGKLPADTQIPVIYGVCGDCLADIRSDGVG